MQYNIKLVTCNAAFSAEKKVTRNSSTIDVLLFSKEFMEKV
jgi:hypothetical protein